MLHRNPVGSIEPAGEGRWRVRVQRGASRSGDPQRIQETVTGTRRDAQLRAAQLAESLGRQIDGADMTLREYWQYVFPTKPSNRGTPRSESTMRWYAGEMGRSILPRLGDVPLDRITHAQVRDCILSAKSPTNCKRTLSAVLRCAYDDGLMPERPLDRRVPVHRDKRRQEPPWTRFEAADAFRLLADSPWEIRAYLCLGMSGLRECEVLGVRPCDIRRESTYSFATGESVDTVTVTVAQTYTDRGGLVPRGKNDHSLRTVPVIPSGRGMLAGAIAESRSAWEGDAASWATARLVAVTGSRLSHMWERALGDAGLRRIPPDMLRHTTDTLALTAGVDPDLNDKMHGRSEHTSTYRNYFRPDVAVMDAAMRRMDGLVSGASGGLAPSGATKDEQDP